MEWRVVFNLGEFDGEQATGGLIEVLEVVIRVFRSVYGS